MEIKFMYIISFCVVAGWGGRERVCHKVICILSILFFGVIKITKLPFLLRAYRLVCIK